MVSRSFSQRRNIKELPQSFIQYSASAANDQFGVSCALSNNGDTAIVGQSGDITFQGTAVVFVRSGKTWTEQALLSQSGGSGGDRFGTSVALSSDGNTAICGVPYRGATDTGAAVVFTRSGATWTQQAVLTHSTAVAQDLLGWSVALSSDGNTAICGAPTMGATNGKSVVFTRSGATWTEQATLTYSIGAAGDLFGWAVDLSDDGNTAAIGAPYVDTSKGTNAGRIIVFKRSGVTWTQFQQLENVSASGGVDYYFGSALSISGNGLVIAGTQLRTSGSRLAEIFSIRDGLTTYVTESAISVSEQTSVALNTVGDFVIFGAKTADTPLGGVDAGQCVGLYRWSPAGFWRGYNSFSSQITLRHLSGATGDFLGASVALSGDGMVAIGGAPEIGSSVGGAVIFYTH
jgi:hypothetical protein